MIFQRLPRFAAIVFVFAQGAATAAAGPLTAGLAVIDVTPPVGYRMAGGYGEIVSRGVADPLKAKALVLEQDDRRLAFVVFDLTGMSRGFTDPARAAAAKASGVPAENIILLATHTHGGPEYMGTLRDLFHDDAVARHGSDPRENLDYPAFLVERTAAVVAAAAKNLRPVRLEGGRVDEPNLAFNRRFHMTDGSVVFNPGKKNPKIVRPAGPTDSEVGFVLFRDADGKPVGGLSTFPMHVAVYGRPEFSADFPAPLAAHLTKVYGDDFVSLFAQGTAGDTNHIDVRTADPDPSPAQVAERLAGALERMRPTLRPITPAPLDVRRAVVKTPLRPYTPEDLAGAKATMREVAAGKPIEFLTAVDAWRVLNTDHLRSVVGSDFAFEIHAVRLGREAAVVTLPHEVFVEIGLAIKKDSPFPQTMVLTMAHDVDFYIPTQRAFAEGSYEVTTSSVQAGSGEQMIEESLKLLRDLKPAE
ncbi:MAG: hypothetical protein ACRC1K_16565 [Planctomycetia bacterium]